MPNKKDWTETPESSNIAGFGYNAETRDLTVEFRGNRRYIYSNVPKNIVRGLRQANSKGKFVSENIKDSYPVRKA